MTVVVMAVVVLAACGGGKDLDTRKVERFIGEDAAARLEVLAVSVSCPSTVDAGKDKTFTCTAKAPDSVDVDVKVRQKDEKGNVSWKINARSTSEVVESIEQGIQKQKKTTVTADCPDIIPIRKGASFTCVVSDEKGGESEVTIVETDDEGSVTWAV